MEGNPVDRGRRAVLKAGGALAFTAVIPLSGCGNSEAPAAGAAASPRFLNDAELRALRAFTDRMIPADTTPGAVAANCAEAIDKLLAAFQVDPPFIYAGGPYSDRGGAEANAFERFVALDPYEALGWRIAIEGSQGLPEREFNGPVKGMQPVYREGLARLDALAVQQGFADFAAAPAPAQDAILGGGDALVAELIDIGFPDTLDAMYGAPEYGGNANLVGWTTTGFDGDVQPRGYTDDQVVNADTPGPLDFLLPASYHDPASRQASRATTATRARAPLAAAPLWLPATAGPEAMLSLVQSADGRMSKLRLALRGVA